MVLNTQSTWPSTRTYVLKLHRDTRFERGRIEGRLENMASGRQFRFESVDDLIACLAADLAGDADGSPHE